MPRKKDEPCSRCKTLLWWSSKGSRPRGQNMCQPCRREARAEIAADAELMATLTSQQRYLMNGRVRTVSAIEQRRRMDEARLGETDRTCECGKVFRGSILRHLCDVCRATRRSHTNRKKNAKRQNRAHGRLYLDTGELITIAALGDRDKWTCWLCDEFVNRALGNRDPWMPSFDHVLPISRGGLDSWDNLRLAHLTCNIKRGNREV